MHNDLKILQKITTAFAIILIILGFTKQANLPSPFWYQQFMPNLHGAQIKDITFTDSLTGYAITGLDSFSVAYLLKTTNGGDNWYSVLSPNRMFLNMKFFNSLIGFIGRAGSVSHDAIITTTDGGNNWQALNTPVDVAPIGMSVISGDSVWIADPTGISGNRGIFRTTNGGVSWTLQYDSPNPNKIYMYNGRMGFMYANDSGSLSRTTNSGMNWYSVPGGGYSDIYFIDSLTGWKANVDMNKTTDGGLSWITETLPSGGIILTSGINRFCVLNKDTIWGAGGQAFYGGGIRRGMLYRTTDGGNNWLFQVPDTSFGIPGFGYIKFLNVSKGWALGSIQGIPRLIHTTNGGDTTFLIGIKQISNEVPKDFKLYQNYPNPFNPSTAINYELKITSYVKLRVYDVTGKYIIDLINQKQNPGTYQVDFSGNGYSSGVYFYRIEINTEKEEYSYTKKMLLIK